MNKCRQAINDRNWEELLSISQSIAAKGKRVVEVGRITVESIRDTLHKTMITEALNNLEESKLYNNNVLLYYDSLLL